jgi:HPt (histidine-containing phosphotransfer) domain-containing protein
VDETDLAAVADAAHALKSLSRNIGAIALGDLCDAIEDAARAGQRPSPAHLESLPLTMDATLDALAATVPDREGEGLRPAADQFGLSGAGTAGLKSA